MYVSKFDFFFLLEEEGRFPADGDGRFPAEGVLVPCGSLWVLNDPDR